MILNTDNMISIILEGANNDILSSNKILDFLNVSAKFHEQNLLNKILILKQSPNSINIKSLNEWHLINKDIKIKNNQKPIYLLAPQKTTYFNRIKNDKKRVLPIKFATSEEKYKIQTGNLKTTNKISYKVISCFDIAQTNIPDNEYHIYKPQLTIDNNNLLHYLKEVAEELNFNISERDLVSNHIISNFNSDKNKIILNKNISEDKKISGMLHELSVGIINSTWTNKIADNQKILEIELLALELHYKYNINISNNSIEYISILYKKSNIDIIDLEKGINRVQKVTNFVSNELNKLSNTNSIDMSKNKSLFAKNDISQNFMEGI